MEAKLVVVGGEAKAGEIRLKLPTVIGRGREASLMVPHPLVSRRHCEIYEQDGQLVVRDLGSLNGTYVNNMKVVGEAFLPPGQLLTIGAVTFRAMYEAVPSDMLPPAPGGKGPNLNETVYAGDGRPGGARHGTTARMAAAAEATVDELSAPGPGKRIDASDSPSDVHSDGGSDFGEVRVDDNWGATKPLPPPAEGEVTENQEGRSPDDSDDALNDFLRNLK